MSVSEIFKSMEYGPAPESTEEANAWLDSHKRKFKLFIGGKWTCRARQSICGWQPRQWR